MKQTDRCKRRFSGVINTYVVNTKKRLSNPQKREAGKSRGDQKTGRTLGKTEPRNVKQVFTLPQQ